MKPVHLIKNSLLMLLLLTFSCKGQSDKNQPVRKPAVAGSFYPGNANELKSELDDFFKIAEQDENKNIAAVIVPHAGYVYSGSVAASAFAKIDRNREYKRIFVIGTSHQVYLKGAAIYCEGDFSTPLGIVPVDIDLAKKLVKENRVFEDNASAHEKEHSLEVQLPFMQYWLKKPYKIVPIIIGTQSESTIQEIANALKPYFTNENLFVISSDFSHYPTYKGALNADSATGNAISSNSPEELLKVISQNEAKKLPGLVTSCCGWSSLLTLLYITSQTPGININHIQYLNSGDSPYGDHDRVVGYHAFTITREKTTSEKSGFNLTDEDKKQLLQLARNTIEFKLKNKDYNPTETYSESLKTSCGAFVTLHKKGNLRGCIGRFITNEPLYLVVQQMALAAAFEDTRFNPVKPGEMADIDIEISVLTPLKRINSIDEFEYGKQGIYIKKGYRTGTFLPQVADETRWSKEEFLGHCAQDKAGIGWDGWKDAELYTYEALVFGEK